MSSISELKSQRAELLSALLTFPFERHTDVSQIFIQLHYVTGEEKEY